MLEPNLLIHGDALNLLERLPSEKVDLVYLDPPWKTKDVGLSLDVNEDYYDFLYKVIVQSKRVLKETGNLFLYSNPELNTDFNLVLKKVFGSLNYVTDFIIPKRGSRSSFRYSHDTVIFYRKSEHQLFNNRIIEVPDEKLAKLYPYKDERGYYQTTSLMRFSYGDRPSLRFLWKGVYPKESWYWKYTMEMLEQLEAQDLIVFGNDDSSIMQKQYLTSGDQYIPINTVWEDINPIDNSVDYEGSQSIKMLTRILQIGSNNGDVILDPFCGSGSMVIASLRQGRQILASDTSELAMTITKQRLDASNLMVCELKRRQLDELPIICASPSRAKLTEEGALLDLIKKGEPHSVEFKESAVWNNRTNQKDSTLIQNIFKAIAAFANSPSGGIILIGVKNDQTLNSLEDDFRAADPKGNQDVYELFLNNKIRHELEAAIISKYTIGFYTINSCTICKIEVLSSDEPIFYLGKFYIRNNNQSIELPPKEFYRYLQSKGK